MKYETGSFLEAAVNVRRGVPDQETVLLIRAFIDQGESLQFLEALLSCNRRAGEGEEQAISRTMTALESLAEANQLISCILMCELWSLASNHGMHDVCDSIDLWLKDYESTRENDPRLVGNCSNAILRNKLFRESVAKQNQQRIG